MKDLFGFELRQQMVTCFSCGVPFMRRRANHHFCSEKCRIRVFYQRLRAEAKAIDAKVEALMKRHQPPKRDLFS
jgi:endogenous inhibitor of DNA gyrase (YacG/DUF329 family)